VDKIAISALVTAGLVLLGFLIANHGSALAGIFGAALLLLLVVIVAAKFWEFVGETVSGLVAGLIPIAVLAVIVLT
jgi:hypothetical protein